MLVHYAKIATGGGRNFIEMILRCHSGASAGLTGSPYGAIGIAFFISFLWWFGVHGQSVVNGVVAVLLSNLDANGPCLLQISCLSVKALILLTQQFLDSFLILSGSESPNWSWLRVNSVRLWGKLLSRQSLMSNEPVVFGFPIVMNRCRFCLRLYRF